MTSSEDRELWSVAVEAPLPNPLTYEIPEELRSDPGLRRGQSVLVPLGRRKVAGLLLGPGKEAGRFALKNIIAINSDRPHLSEPFTQWLEWLSRYYLHPVGAVIESVFPPLDRTLKRRKSHKSPITPRVLSDSPPQLTQEQNQVINRIQSHLGFQTHLVHGVTGSGKTEIYMHLLQNVVARGKQGIVLVPEISLTPQLVERFARRLGDAVAVIHSHLTPREKTDQWWAMVEGRKQILIGARSALFCPLPNLGMIVVDEEHEASFKQDEKLKYHARDAAIMLAKFSNCPVVLGSATPSLETWHNAKSGRYLLHQLKLRVANRQMPEIEIIDLREERDDRKISGETELPFWLTKKLYIGLQETMEKGEQAAFFLNRRGIAQAVVCQMCGFSPECPNCAVKLTLHGKSHLLCHYCGYHESLTERCSNCPDGEPKPIGLGTEAIEKDLSRLFPAAKIARMDRDEIATREDLERMIKQVENREVDILVGTQMIAKGLDFTGLTLVGLVMADVAFNLPDFRASERSFQLLTQVSGRSGRHLDTGKGRVFIQTYNPDHPSILYTCAHDFEAFADFELGFRESLKYPPFSRLAGLRIQGAEIKNVKTAAALLKTRALNLKTQSEKYADLEILGPAEAPMAKLRNLHRWQMLLKAPDPNVLNKFCAQLLSSMDWVPSAVKITADIDAIHLL